MRRIVAQQVEHQLIVILQRDNRNLRVLFQLAGEIPQIAIHPDRQSRFGEAGPDIGRYFRAVQRPVVSPDSPIWQRQCNHPNSSH